MVIHIRKWDLIAVFCLALLVVAGSFVAPRILHPSPAPSKTAFAGGALHSGPQYSDPAVSAARTEDDIGGERFQRPSKALPYPNPYSFQDFRREDERPPLVSTVFSTPEEVILAYYGILRDAANMRGYSGGCGTIGWSTLPYPYAYSLLTAEHQAALSLEQFANSFRGIGYITLLKLLPAYTPPDLPAHTRYYMVEIEVITGAQATSEEDYRQGSRFAYFYGLVTANQTPDRGWKIGAVDYIAEDFLCAPMHSWFYLSDAVVQIVYGDNLKLIEQIDQVEQTGDQISIFASGKGKSYRFDFVRLTNGYDILLHEYILDGGAWKETSLLTNGWENMKLTIDDTELLPAI